ncbi:MAG: ABC transporter permease [Acidimicrobiia bacterium]
MTSGTLLSRVVPPAALGSRRALRLVERNLMVYRRAWVIIFSGFFEPVFYLFAVGVGIGVLVGDIDMGGGRMVSYAEFVAPAMLASSAMNGAVYESTMNIFFKLRWAKTYDAVLATPLGPGDVATGEITWSLMRGAIYAVCFLIVMVAMGLMPSLWGFLALPAALLIGFAFAAVGMAATTYMKSWQDFDLVALVTLPLFLFSATFYPISVYPEWLQTVARFSPLYHGTDLIRGLTLGVLDWSLLGHVGVLGGMGLVGALVASRRIEQLLLK